VVVVDTCHSGAIRLDRWRGNVKDDLNQAVKLALSEYTRAKSKRGVVLLAACLSDEQARENKKWQHGALTLAVLECLQGQRDEKLVTQDSPPLPAEGVLNLHQVYDYALKRVKELGQNGQAVAIDQSGDIVPAQIPLAVVGPH